ncbi:LacI family transcriptional regulator [Aureibaculum marinum]|uniref:LacI family transcriptional regulator n=1 Tax=Aureibaculum marinum TaxID=2487930 RepID=A0A3N4NWF4_9FLAO|nr:LacI family DNA-binding transcriptional regulator [Aureibaculum marinum]RPE00176.1 LacI family transcriptional regulator [Aureibaculum marinum]
MGRKITLKDIAKELEVSTSTVSKALNDSNEISEELREKIKAFADFYRYRPNMTALKLRNKKTMVIGVIIPEIVHHFFSEIISGIEKMANGRSYNVMVCVSSESYEKEKLNLEMLSNGSVDGILVSIAKETLELGEFDHFKELEDYNIPLVLFDRVSDEIYCDKVVVDDEASGYKATKYFMDIGRKKICILSTPDHVTVGALRTIGYKKAIQDSGLEIDNRLIFKVNDKTEIYSQIQTYLNSLDEWPDAIVGVNEIYAAIALKVTKEKGFKVPDDVAVLGFTDGLISQFSTPAITAMVQHGYLIGEQAASLLLDRIQNKKDNENFETVVISTDLKIRESTEKKLE